jgi:hypothetical protein
MVVTWAGNVAQYRALARHLEAKTVVTSLENICSTYSFTMAVCLGRLGNQNNRYLMDRNEMEERMPF